MANFQHRVFQHRLRLLLSVLHLALVYQRFLVLFFVLVLVLHVGKLCCLEKFQIHLWQRMEGEEIEVGEMKD